MYHPVYTCFFYKWRANITNNMKPLIRFGGETEREIEWACDDVLEILERISPGWLTKGT
jgi:hypothetical protein